MKYPGSITHQRPDGFALVVTLILMVLLMVLTVGLLSLSAVTLRSAGAGDAQATARANARLAVILAIGELQKELGPDQRITAPASLLDSNPQTPAIEGIDHGHLTGVWNARDEEPGETPDYAREPSFRRWLVSNTDPTSTESLTFAANGTLTDPIDIAPGSERDATPVRAGRIPAANGRLAWWVADENTKALSNPRDETDRNGNTPVAGLLAGFGSPGAHGITTLDGLADFPSNTETSDKAITRETLGFVHPQAGGGRFFHDLSPYPRSVLASVTRGGLRQDLSLYLERTDINWLQPWGRAEGVSSLPAGPLGPNGALTLGGSTHDLLPWKTLHHWQFMHRRQLADQDNLSVAALFSNTPAPDPVSNPAWNNGNTRLSPVLVRMQSLISFGVETKTNTEDEYDLFMYNFPVVILWNPYNVPLRVDGINIATASLPLEHTIYKNGNKVDLGTDRNLGTLNGIFVWGWRNGAMYIETIGGSHPSIVMAPGESRLFSYSGAPGGRRFRYDLRETPPAWLPGNAGRRIFIGTVKGQPQDRISVGTACATWEVSGSILNQDSFGGNQLQTTFEVRAEPRTEHVNQSERYKQQMFSSQIGWRHEAANPRPDTISQWNLPNSSLADLNNNPSPFLLLDVRLKSLDDPLLPNKNWLHNIPHNPFVAATSTAKHSAAGVDASTNFFAHPYNVTFEQVNNAEGIFQNRPFFGSSYRPGGRAIIVAAPIPLAPLTSLAQLQNFPVLPMDALNWSGYHFQNLAIGNSFALPALRPDQAAKRSFPFYLGQYFAWQGGDVAGKLYDNVSWFTNDQYTVPPGEAEILDRSHIANHLLFDDHFFSSMAAQTGPVFRRYGAERNLPNVVSEFLNGTTPLPVAAYLPHFPAGATPSEAVDLLIDGNDVTPEAHRLAAAHLMAEGGFNINSTSVDAWTAVLSAAKKKRPVIMPDGASLKAEPPGEHIISRNPNPTAADDSEESRWLGYRELTDAQIRELAEAVVRQVKKRGPFRSLGEFVNRRLSTDEDMALHGAIQAALEDPGVSINADYRGAGKEIAAADIAGTNYEFPAAALGSRYQGTPADINQADILTPIAPIIQARSDTFVVRGYGEARSPDGTRILARAWCEAVVQRVPDYLDPAADPAETPHAALQSPANRQFGRRFHIVSFQWLRGGAL